MKYLGFTFRYNHGGFLVFSSSWPFRRLGWVTVDHGMLVFKEEIWMRFAGDLVEDTYFSQWLLLTSSKSPEFAELIEQELLKELL